MKIKLKTAYDGHHYKKPVLGYYFNNPRANRYHFMTFYNHSNDNVHNFSHIGTSYMTDPDWIIKDL